MSVNDKKILAIVPARSGSKSIPDKNMREIGGISLIGRAALVIGELKWIDKKIISTDSPKYCEEGIKYGLDVPFVRPRNLSTDLASSLDVWIHAWLECEKYYGTTFDISILIEPTCPLRIAEDILRSVEKVAIDGETAALTVSRTPAHFTPEKALRVNYANELQYYIGDSGSKYHTRQFIKQYFHRNGACYAVSRDHLITHRRIIEGAHAIIIERPLTNIDDLFELEMTEWMYSYYKMDDSCN